jgi:hypothetical protein
VVDARLINVLDRVAAAAVPASEILNIGGWLARRSPGLATKRVNSVLALAHPDDERLERNLSAVERFYSERGLNVAEANNCVAHQFSLGARQICARPPSTATSLAVM